MQTVSILLPNLSAIRQFVSIVADYDFDIDLVSGRYRIDAKSLMGIFSLGVDRPLTLELRTEDTAAAHRLLQQLAPFLAAE